MLAVESAVAVCGVLMSDSFTAPEVPAGAPGPEREPAGGAPAGPAARAVAPAPVTRGSGFEPITFAAPLREPRRRTPKLEIVASALALTVVAWGLVLISHAGSGGNASAQPVSAASGAAQGAAPAPSSPPTALPEAATCVASLTACLLPAPSGSSPLGGSWGGSPAAETVDEYVGNFYRTQSVAAQVRLKARFAADGLTAIAKRTWTMPGGEEVDDELFSFGTENGAQSWFDSDSHADDGTAFTVPGGPSVRGDDRAPNSSGVAWTVVYGYADSTAMEMWIEKDDRTDEAEAVSLAPLQMQAIEAHGTERVVPVAASPSAAPYSPAGGGSAACAAGQIDSCLISRPVGAVVWTGEPYYAQTDVTIEQYVDEGWNEADQANMIQVLTTAGVRKIAHHDWTTVTDRQANVTVLQYASADEAQLQDQSFQEVLPGEQFHIPGISAVGVVRTMNSGGDVDVEISGDSGPYQLVVEFFCPASADVAGAVQLFEQDYDLLPAG